MIHFPSLTLAMFGASPITPPTDIPIHQAAAWVERERRALYARVFDNPDGRQVLADLAHHTRVFSTQSPTPGPSGAMLAEMAEIHGAKRVVLTIAAYLEPPPPPPTQKTAGEADLYDI